MEDIKLEGILTQLFSSLSHFLPFSLYPLDLSGSTHRLALLKKKKNSCFSSLFSLTSTEISRKWKYLEKYNKKEQWKFLVIFPKRSIEISSLPIARSSPNSLLSLLSIPLFICKFQIGLDAFSKLHKSGWGSSYFFFPNLFSF